MAKIERPGSLFVFLLKGGGEIGNSTTVDCS